MQMTHYFSRGGLIRGGYCSWVLDTTAPTEQNKTTEMMLFNGISIKLLAVGTECFFNAENSECVIADAILDAQDKDLGRVT